MSYTCTKRLGPFPFAHRQPLHDGHCSLIHGHSWFFELTFARLGPLDSNYFVYDFGKLKEVKSELDCKFDHTLVLNTLDPALDRFRKMEQDSLCKLTVIPNASAEGIAAYVYTLVDTMIRRFSDNLVHVHEVKVFEESGAFATYRPQIKI